MTTSTVALLARFGTVVGDTLTELASQSTRREFGLQTRFRVFPQCQRTYRFSGAPFSSVEIGEFVVATNSLTFAQYLHCRRFALSVEIFYNDTYLEEIHGLIRALGLSMFEFVEHCHAQVADAPVALRGLYEAVEDGIRDNLWESRAACLEHFRDPAHLEQYAREEYKTSLGTLKAIALLEHIEPVLTIARDALWKSILAAWVHRPSVDALPHPGIRMRAAFVKCMFDERAPDGGFENAGIVQSGLRRAQNETAFAGETRQVLHGTDAAVALVAKGLPAELFDDIRRERRRQRLEGHVDVSSSVPLRPRRSI